MLHKKTWQRHTDLKDLTDFHTYGRNAGWLSAHGDLSPILCILKRSFLQDKFARTYLPMWEATTSSNMKSPRVCLCINYWLACTFWYNRAQYLKGEGCSGLMERQKRGVLAVRTCDCRSIPLNKFLVPPLVAYLPDEASRVYSSLQVPGYLSLLIKILEAYLITY